MSETYTETSGPISAKATPLELITSCAPTSNKDSLIVDFRDATFTFHAQWLHDTRCDIGASRNFSTAFCQKPPRRRIQDAYVVGKGPAATVNVTWDDMTTSQFPALWLRVMAPLVAKPHDQVGHPTLPKGWLVSTLTIPEVSYHDIFSSGRSEAVKVEVLDNLLDESATGIVKVIGLPAPNLEEERNKTNTLVTQLLKQLFGSVFQHPRRATDQTFNVASDHLEDAKRGAALPNYDTNQILLPHSDHAHYTNPARLMGWYCLEGESINTFIDTHAVLETLQEEEPELFEQLHRAPMVTGRSVDYYGSPFRQATVDTVLTMQPGFPDKIKRVRWHPYLTGSLLTPYEQFNNARRAHLKFQEIMRRDTHQLSVILKPGDLYVWDNFRLLHGREKVIKVPRTGVGQTVPEDVVEDNYRAVKFEKARNYVEDQWLVYMPNAQLDELVKHAEFAA